MTDRQKSQSQKMTTPLAILAQLLRECPVQWTPAELATTLGVSKRSAERACSRLKDQGLIESRRGSYTISHDIVQNILGSKWYYKKQIDKDIKTARKS